MDPVSARFQHTNLGGTYPPLLFVQLNILSPHSGENFEHPDLGLKAVNRLTSRNCISKPFGGLLLLILLESRILMAGCK